MPLVPLASFGFIWRHLASSSSSFNIQNDMGRRRHRHKSIINRHFEIWWRQAVMSFWRHLTSSNRHFYPSRHWRLPLTCSILTVKCTFVSISLIALLCISYLAWHPFDLILKFLTVQFCYSLTLLFYYPPSLPPTNTHTLSLSKNLCITWFLRQGELGPGNAKSSFVDPKSTFSLFPRWSHNFS